MKIKNIFKNFKKNIVTYLTCFLSVVAFCTLAMVAYGKIAEKCNCSESGKTIILDAGHGGEDGGAVGVDGVVETSGYKVIMTRDTDTAIYDDDVEGLKNKKRSDLHNRAKIIKDNSEGNNIFVSIHQNKFPDSKYFGTQIFYSKNDAKSQTLACSIKDSVVGLIQPDNTREIKPADKRIFLLEKSEIPAVVVECGFLSNKEEASKLIKDEYQRAFCVYCGITDYFLNNA